MKTIYKFLIITLLLTGFAQDSSSQTFDSTYAGILQAKLQQLKTGYNLVGISGAAYVPGQGFWTGTAGISSSDSDKIIPEMVMSNGSITKNYISAIILQLQQEDSLDINDPLGNWLPAYNNIPDTITIKQLLDHTSGIYNVTDNGAFINAVFSDLTRYWTIEEVLEGNFVLNPYFAPGSGFHYSNTNYMILGMIISRIMKTTLAEQFKRRIFNPYQMNKSFFEVHDTVTSPFAHNWSDLTGSGVIQDIFHLPLMAFNSSTIGAGGVICTARDQIIYLKALFEEGMIDKNSLSQMLIFRPVSFAGANGYGLGLMRYNVGGRSCYGHGGNSLGYSAVMIYDPTDNIAITLMINKDISAAALGISFMQTAIQNNPVTISSTSEMIPEEFKLSQNYPNPFNPETIISFSLPKSEFVKLSVHNITGQEIEILYEGDLQPGEYSYKWNAGQLASGIYFYKFTSLSNAQSKKMMLMK